MKFGFVSTSLLFLYWREPSISAFVPVGLVPKATRTLQLLGSTQQTVVATSPSFRWYPTILLASTVEVPTTETTDSNVLPPEEGEHNLDGVNGGDVNDEELASNTRSVTAAEIKERLERQLTKLREKDSKSPKLNKEDIKVAYEDEHIIVVEKPSGVLCVPSGRDGSFPNLAESVCEGFGCQMGRADMMVVHRLGMDTSGLVVFAKTMEAVRGMNTIFRTRQIERKYEALVCGHVERDEGLINLPLMRDYEFPPFMRISTNEHQRVLATLSPDEVGKKLLETPKESLTKYQVLAREEYGSNGLPVTRIALTSISGRTHQLNVHLAAIGHPIVGDGTYGINGDAAMNGGLTDAELETLVGSGTTQRADVTLQEQLADAAKDKPACIHAKSLKFRHPVTKEDLFLSTEAPL